MKVTLINYTPNPDQICAQAALVSKWNKGYTDFIPNWNDGTDMVHLEEAIIKGHISVIEHASFTFSLEGISRALSHQLVRHRLASYTQQSQRYVEFEIPNKGGTINRKLIEEIFVFPQKLTEEQRGILEDSYYECLVTYKRLIDSGVKPEDARFIMPNATKTNIIVTMNARELIHFFGLRCCWRAQWELREVAWKMLKLARDVAPIIFEKAGPQCYRLGYCPEQMKECPFFGKIDEN